MTKHEEYYLELEKKKIDLYIKQIEMKNMETRRKGFIRIFIGTFLGLIVSACMYYLFTNEIPAGNKDVVIALVSGLTGAFFGSVVTYYFGDSEGRSDGDSTPSFQSPPPKALEEENATEIEIITPRIEEPEIEEGFGKE